MKPKFDPNKPFEASEAAPAAKPKFDPNGAFEEVATAPKTRLESIAHSLKSGSENFSNSALVGYLPQVAGAATAAIGGGRDALSGEIPSGAALRAYYGQGKDDAIDTLKRDTEESPVLGHTGALAGMVMSPLNKLITPFKAAQGAGVLAKMGNAAKNGAMLGAVYNPGDTKDSDALQLRDRLGNAAVGGAVGGSIDGALQAAGPLAKKGISTLLGPSKEGIEKYLANRTRINKAPTLATMKDTIDGQIQTMRTRVQMGEMSVGQAKSGVKDLEAQLQQLKRDTGRDYSAQMPELRQSLDAAKTELEAQKITARKPFEDVAHPREIADDVHGAVKSLKGQVVAESAKARDILEKSNDKIFTQPLVKYAKQEIANLMIDGNLPVTASGKAAVARLETLADDLSKYPSKLEGADAKQLMKHLDEEVDYVREAGGFGDSYGQALKGVRRTIDEQLKQNPDYAEQMKVVSRKTGVLDAANDLFGTREKAFSTMNGIANDGKVPQRDLLHALGSEVGSDFKAPVEKFAKAQEQLRDMGPIYDALPANEKIKFGQDMVEIAPHLKGTAVESVAAESGIPERLTERNAELERLQRDLHLANESAAPFSGWGKNSTQNKLQSLISRSEDRASIESKRELALLDQARPEGEPSYLESIDDNRVRSEFTRDNTRGSRNTLMWRGLGAAAGGLTGHLLPGASMPMTLGGGAVGGVLGGYIDKNGGQLAKGLLDNYLDNPQVYNGIRNMNPNNVVSPWIGLGAKQDGGN